MPKHLNGFGIQARRLLHCGLACLLLFAGGAAEAKNVGLLIAVGHFQQPTLSGMALEGPAGDIAAVRSRLVSQWGFVSDDLHQLRDADATHDHILTEISALEQRSAPGDTVLIYFSGHGTSSGDQDNRFDLPYATGAWVPWDFDTRSKKAIIDSLIVGRRDLLPQLKKLDESGRLVVVISDSCFSGQVVRSALPSVFDSRFMPLMLREIGGAAPSAPGARPIPPPYPYHHVVLLSASSDSETAADISTPAALSQAPTVDGQPHGAFTDALLRALDGKLLKGTFTYAQAREAISAQLERHQLPQHPQILPSIAEDEDNIGSLAFLGGMPGAVAGAVPDEPPSVLRVQADGVPEALRKRISGLAGVNLVTEGPDLLLRVNGAQAELLAAAGDPILVAPVNDARLVRRIASEAWLRRVLPAADHSLGLRADTEPGSRGGTFVQGETLSIAARARGAVHLLILDLDPSGSLTVLYPASRAELEHLVPENQSTTINSICAQAPFGTDLVTVVAFSQQPDLLQGVQGVAEFSTDGPSADVLAAGLRNTKGAIDVAQIAVHTYAGKDGRSCRN